MQTRLGECGVVGLGAAVVVDHREVVQRQPLRRLYIYIYIYIYITHFVYNILYVTYYI